MSAEGTIALVAFVMATSAILLCFTLAGGQKARLDARLDDLVGRRPAGSDPSSVGEFARAALPKVGTALLPSSDKERTMLRSRLIHAGFYGRQAMPIFLGVKMILILSPAFCGLAIGTIGLAPRNEALAAGALCGVFGMIAPSFWLDKIKKKRQIVFRRSIPDALDLLVICVEGGLSLPGALKRVSYELRSAHPSLAAELNIVQREVLLGRTAGEALHQMGVRTDLDEIRSLASVINQAERFGASLIKSLRVHAESLRLKRQQRAEAMAQQAATKILFPTLLFIFPAILVVILGPAFFQIMSVFDSLAL